MATQKATATKTAAAPNVAQALRAALKAFTTTTRDNAKKDKLIAKLQARLDKQASRGGVAAKKAAAPTRRVKAEAEDEEDAPKARRVAKTAKVAKPARAAKAEKVVKTAGKVAKAPVKTSKKVVAEKPAKAVKGAKVAKAAKASKGDSFLI